MVQADGNQVRLVIQDLRENNKFYNITCDADATVEDLKCLICIESQVEIERQELFFSQAMLTVDTRKLNEIGITDNDMINMGISNLNTDEQDMMNAFMSALPGTQAHRPRLTQQQLNNQMFHNAQNMRIKSEITRIQQQFASDPHFKTRLAQGDEDLLAALTANNYDQIKRLVTDRLKEVMAKQKAEQERQIRLRNADPNDTEAQKLIEEDIRKQMIQNDYEQAMENNPEFFGNVTMLYIDTKINGAPVQAFVDSGAQSTIISQRCAEQCGVLHKLDTRFAGMAIGVGSSKILGRVHLADMKLLACDQMIQVSLTVLEDNKVDLLFGLDNLKRHQCCIDLVEHRLHFNRGEFSVPFLSDGEIKKNAFESEKDLMLERQKSHTSESGNPAAAQSPADEAVTKELVDMGFPAAQV